MDGLQRSVTGEFFASVHGNSLERHLGELGSQYSKGNLHGPRGLVRHGNREVEAHFSLDECRQTSLAFTSAGHYRIQFAMSEALLIAHFFETLMNQLFERKAYPFLWWFVAFSLMQEQRQPALKFAGLQPGIVFSSEEHFSLPLSTVLNFLGWKGLLQIMLNLSRIRSFRLRSLT